MQLETAVKKRKSVKSFSDKKVDWRKILQAIEYARFSPMAGNQYTVKFLLVSDKEKIKLVEGACQQNFVGKTDYLVIVVSDRAKVKKLYDYYDKGFGAQQAGAAIQNFLLALTERGLSSCWVGFFEDSIVKREFAIPDSMTVEAVFPIGFESKASKQLPKPKPDLNTLVFFDKWNKKHMGQNTSPTFDNS